MSTREWDEGQGQPGQYLPFLQGQPGQYLLEMQGQPGQYLHC